MAPARENACQPSVAVAAATGSSRARCLWKMGFEGDPVRRQGIPIVNATDLKNVSLACQKDSSQNCVVEDSFCLPSLQDEAIDGENGRHRPRQKAGPDDNTPLAVLLIWTLENEHPAQAKRNRGLFASVTAKPSRAAILRVAPGT
jgi:hypothetical protein